MRMEVPGITIDASTRNNVIETLFTRLRENYVFPHVADEIEEFIRQRLSSGEYDTITETKSLANKLTEQMREISKDKHLGVFYTSEPLPEQRDNDKATQWWEDQWPLQNYTFTKVERLAGNVGYLDFRAFLPPEFAGDTAVAAMNFLTNTSALIIDLRQNNGGDPAMVALLCSYFFPPEPVHLNSLYWRARDSTQQFWTLPYVPGKRYLDKPVYVLTSHHTFSGAEEFTYNLKNLKRATIIGEITRGGAHPTDTYRLSNQLGAYIPTGRAISPITGTNWEGTGVLPDIEVAQEQAFDIAYQDALQKILATFGDQPTPPQQELANKINKVLQEQQHAHKNV